MTDKSNETLKPTDEQVDKIILPSMEWIAKQCAVYINELRCRSEFIALMLRDIAYAFEN